MVQGLMCARAQNVHQKSKHILSSILFFVLDLLSLTVCFKNSFSYCRHRQYL
ncbi:hypothetical protein BJX70DRAFT_361420 [Aspergillus crustosus]